MEYRKAMHGAWHGRVRELRSDKTEDGENLLPDNIAKLTERAEECTEAYMQAERMGRADREHAVWVGVQRCVGIVPVRRQSFSSFLQAPHRPPP